MARLITFFMVILAIQFTMLILINPSDNINTNVQCSWNANGTTTCAQFETNNSGNMLWIFATNTSYWNNAEFILTIVGIAGTLGLVGITAGSAFGFKTDFLIFGIAILGFLSLGSILIELGSLLTTTFSDWLTDKSINIVCDGCYQANILTGACLGVFALYYVWTVVEWWRGKDT